MADLINSKKEGGDELYGQLRNYSLFVEDAVQQTANVVTELNTVEIPKMEREQVDLEYDLHRLEELNVKYPPTTRELLQVWAQFDKEMDGRVG